MLNHVLQEDSSVGRKGDAEEQRGGPGWVSRQWSGGGGARCWEESKSVPQDVHPETRAARTYHILTAQL